MPVENFREYDYQASPAVINAGFLSGMDRPIQFLSPGPDTTDFHLEIVSAITHHVA